MITYKKLRTFARYDGIFEYFVRGSWFLFHRTTHDEFVRIGDLIKEARKIQDNQFTGDMAERAKRQIEQECDKQKTIDYLYELSKDDKYFPDVWHPPVNN